MDANNKQATRDYLMTKYMNQALNDVVETKIKIEDIMHNDMLSFMNHTAYDDVPQPRRALLFAYTEEAYIQGADTWSKMSDVYLLDSHRVAKLASDILPRNSQ